MVPVMVPQLILSHLVLSHDGKNSWLSVRQKNLNILAFSQQVRTLALISLCLISRLRRSLHPSFYIHTTRPHNAYLCIDFGVASSDVVPPCISPDHLLSGRYCDGNSGTDESTASHYGDSYQPNIDGTPFVRELRRREYGGGGGELM
jgi:hypothetical protein